MPKTRGTITFVFDDGYEKVYQNVLPLLDEYSMPGVFALSIDASTIETTEQRKIRPWQKWLSITARGHEIASHSVNHPNLTTLNDHQLKQELGESGQKLKASTIVYPGGAVDDHVALTARQIYSAGRTVQYGFEKLPPKDPMRLRSYNFSRNNFSVAKANRLALWACLSGSWLIETYHMVDDQETAMVHTVKTSDFRRHLAFVARLPVAVKTIHEAVNLH